MIPTPGAHPTATWAAILAHQGGWDEIAMVAAPVAVIAVLLAVANRRARRNPPADE
jgi:predicted MFS family arabinose efflux permease